MVLILAVFDLKLPIKCSLFKVTNKYVDFRPKNYDDFRELFI